MLGPSTEEIHLPSERLRACCHWGYWLHGINKNKGRFIPLSIIENSWWTSPDVAPTWLIEYPGCTGYRLVYLPSNTYRVSGSGQEKTKPTRWKSGFATVCYKLVLLSEGGQSDHHQTHPEFNSFAIELSVVEGIVVEELSLVEEIEELYWYVIFVR